MENENLDILMGKFIDGEISPAEQTMLDEQLAGDASSRELLERFRRLHEQTRQVVREELATDAAPVEEIFERAWNSAFSGTQFIGWRIGGEWMRFVAGLAAGLVIGAGLMWAAMGTARNNGNTPIARPGPMETANPIAQVERHDPIAEQPSDAMRTENRKINWVTFPEPSGDQLLIEGFERQRITPAMYYGDL
jgi:hypothetical protein